MSSRTNNKRVHPALSAVAAIITAVAVVATGLTAFPPATALAARPQAVVLGVDEATAVVIGPEVSIGEKFEVVTETVETTTHPRLMLPVKKRKAIVAKKTEPKPAVSRVKSHEGRAKRPAKKSSEKSSEKAKSSSGWKKAKASWYGPGLYGNGMAGGGKLKKNSMVVAHRSLPFGTKIKIKYKGKTVTAVVKDRGPFIKGRIFDLGPGTAKALGFSGVGTIKYKIVR